MTRYVGTGEGRWTGGLEPEAYRYAPSTLDRRTASDLAVGIVDRIDRERKGHRTGYGDRFALDPRWYASGVLGEVAALFPFGLGPDVDLWSGSGWYGRPDYGNRVEVRTVSRWSLYRGRAPFAGWRVTAKDRGRVIVCVIERDDDLLVLGCADVDDLPLLAEPLGRVLAIVEPADLWALRDLRP